MTSFTTATLALALLGASVLPAPDTTLREQATATLSFALAQLKSADLDRPQSEAIARRAATRARDLLPPFSQAREILDAGLREKESLAAISEAYDLLTFEPLMEADLPVGFPAATPLGEIEVKEYPEYRLARAPMGFTGQNGAFWVLFQHIKKNDIAMTAPVEVSYGDPDEKPRRGRAMAFLYGDPALGELGGDGKVEVSDIPAMTVLSTGIRGSMSRTRIEEARRRLLSWLDAHSEEYEAAGDLRTMGYNSPMVPRRQRYSEVQIPIRRKPAGRVATF